MISKQIHMQMKVSHKNSRAMQLEQFSQKQLSTATAVEKFAKVTEST